MDPVLLKATRKELIRYIDEARSERDGLQRDLFRIQQERDQALTELGQLRAQAWKLRSDTSSFDSEKTGR